MLVGSLILVLIGVKNLLSVFIENSILVLLGIKVLVGVSIGVSYGCDVFWKFGCSFSFDDFELVLFKIEGKLQGNDNVFIFGGQCKLIKDMVDMFKLVFKKVVKVNVLVNMVVVAGVFVGMVVKFDVKGGKILVFDWWNVSFLGVQVVLNILVMVGSIYYFVLNKFVDVLVVMVKEEVYVSNMKFGQSGIEMIVDSLFVLVGVLFFGNKCGMVNIEIGMVVIMVEMKGLKKLFIDLNLDKISLVVSDVVQMLGMFDFISLICMLVSNNFGVSIVFKYNFVMVKLILDGFFVKFGKVVVVVDLV